ncbi:hypothetical protein [Clostridium sp.]
MKTILNSIFNEKQHLSFYNIWGVIKIKDQSSSIWLENITTLKM